MPRDYKNRKPQPEPPRKAPGWLWLIAGLLIGLFVAFLVYLREHQPSPVAEVEAGAVAAPATPARKKAPPRAPVPKPRFEFYTILPEMEIPVPESDLQPRAAKPRAGGEPEAGASYLLQVGSFRSYAEADRLKARLAIIGLEAAIQTVAVDGKATWHRVRLGPFDSLSRLDEARSRLADEGLQSMVLKVKT